MRPDFAGLKNLTNSLGNGLIWFDAARGWTGLVILPRKADLIVEHSEIKQDIKDWDKALSSLGAFRARYRQD